MESNTVPVWPGWETVRLIGRGSSGAVYEIEIKNPAHVCRGVKAVTVDGNKIDGNVLPVCDGGEHLVEAVMG